MTQKALLTLADGSVFYGKSIGVDGQTVGEVVFNTAMTGYQEILTDPSYSQQIVTLTYPHIGNVGITEEDAESANVAISGLIIRDDSLVDSNWRSTRSLRDYLTDNKIVAIAGIDTRRLTRILREKGAQSGCIITGSDFDHASVMSSIREFPGLQGVDLAKQVSTKESYCWNQGTWNLGSSYDKSDLNPNDAKFHVVAYDFGVKRNILRLLVNRQCRVTVVPASTSARDVLAMNPDGIFLSNGPGDPEPCDYAITAIQEFLERSVPIFGICLGHQLLALACAAKTEKMKLGHHGANHPVKDLKTGQVMITSQNHGFAVDENSLPSNVNATHRSLFDNSLQGIELTDKPAFGFQGHPEASPGPHDVDGLFDKFVGFL